MVTDVEMDKAYDDTPSRHIIEVKLSDRELDARDYELALCDALLKLKVASDLATNLEMTSSSRMLDDIRMNILTHLLKG